MTVSTAINDAQRRLWTLVQMRPADPFFNLPFAVDLDGPLDLPALRAAYRDVVARHPALRSHVTEHEQLEHPPSALPLPVVDAARDEWDALGTEFGSRPFDLAVAPLLRALLLRDGDTHRLVVSTHHIVFDGHSLGVFVAELAAAYGARRAGTEPLLPALPASTGDAAAGDDARYWIEKLRGAPEAVGLPVPRTRSTDHRAARADTVLPQHLVERLDALARSRRVTMFMLLKTAWDAVLQQYGTGDVLMAVAMSGRDRSELATTIGYLAKTVVLRSDLGDDPGFTTALRRVRDDVLDAHEHPDLPFEAVTDALRPARDGGHHPLFQVMFGHDDEPARADAAGVTFTERDIAETSMKVDLTIGHRAVPGGLQAELGYRRALLGESDAAALLAALRRVLERVASRPDVRISDALVPDPEPAPVTTPADAPAAATVGDLVVARARLAPDAVAVADVRRPRTYRELVAEAASLARRLPHGTTVGICLPPSAELVVAILAGSLAGATVVPLDPDLPAFLLRTTIDDAGIDHVVADERTSSLLDRTRVAVVDPTTGDDGLSVGDDGADDTAQVGRPAAAALYIDPTGGDPSGVLVTDAALVWAVTRAQAADDTLRRGTVRRLVVPTAATDLVTLLASLAAGATLDPQSPPGQDGATAGVLDVAEPGLDFVPDGHPLPGVPATVLDPRGRAVDVGAVGELHLGGPVVPAGYLDRPELAAERLTRAGWYATGRRARRLSDGRIVAADLSAAAGPGRTSPVDGSAAEPTGTVTGESTDRMAALWADVLGREVAPDQNFFDVGGNSLLLVRLRSRLEDEFGVRVDVVELFRHATQIAMVQLTTGRGVRPDPEPRAPAGSGSGHSRRAAVAARARQRTSHRGQQS